MKQWRKFLVMASSVLLFSALLTNSVAAQYTSTHYETNEVFFGSGGELNQTSPSYSAKSAVGELGIGNSTSSSYQIHAGFNTTEQPFLEFVVTGSNINLGYLSTSAVTTATGTFTVRAWQSSGYIVQTDSTAPTSNGPSPHTMATPASPTASAPGTEQFGIDVVKNANFCGAGCDLGADPVQVPSGGFSSGAAATNYNTSDVFMYHKGDTIARATQSTSITDYTISYIFNISTATPAGQYTFTHVLVATATY
jgi:hypothetical protein